MTLKDPYPRWRVLALVVGTGLAVLFFVGIPMQWLGDNDSVDVVVGTAHGFLYMAYVAMTLEFGLRRKWSLLKIVLVAGAGTIPLMGFYAEHRVTVDEKARVAQELQPVS